MKKIATLLIASISSFWGLSQINATVNSDAQALAEMLAGPNITVTNATLTGSNQASGSFSGTSNVGIGSGVILSTGAVTEANGANNAANVGVNLNSPGTAEMTALAGTNTFDAITLQFDFEVQSEFIQFDYVFASEEYPEYAPPISSNFNDVFAFYISGPGITGSENIALVPNTSDAVAINNINPATNTQYYVDNTGGTTVQFDGFTTLLTAKKEGLIPCNTYTLRLVIADAGDAVYSSAVFLKENSLIQGIVDVNTQTVNSDNIALEGCIKASFGFSIDEATTTDTEISYQIGGTATNGIDYETIDTVLTIPAGQTNATVFIQAIQDGFAEGQESIYIIYKPQPCSEPDTAFLYINDAQPIEFSTDGTDLTCHDNASGIIDFDASGGFPPYTYHITTDGGNGTTTTYNAEPITGLDAGLYSVQVYDIYGCKAEALVIGGAFDAGQTFLPDGSGAVYTSDLEISGFGANQTMDDIEQLQQICMNLEHSYMGDLQLKIISPSGQEVILKDYPGGGSCDLGEPIATAPVDGQASSTLTDPGVGYDYCFNANPDYGTMVAESGNYTRDYTDAQGHNYQDNYLPAGSYTSANPLSGLVGSQLNGTWTVEVTDNLGLDNGYIFNWNIVFGAGLPDTLVQLEEPTGVNVDGFITQANCGGSDGAINISVTGDYGPYTYLWSNGATTEDISNVSAGTYEVFVTDVNNCTDSAEFILNNISSMSITSNISQVICSGGNTGAIDITASGGTAPYTYSWSNSETTEDISNLTAGDYTVTITDANGCTFSKTISVTEIPSIDITAVTGNEECGTWNGSVATTVTGGSGSYGYSWSNGATTPTISNLQAGTYTLDVTDANGCTAQQSFSIINDVSNCSQYCYLTINETITEDNCGQGNGAIDVTIADATNPYTFTWSNGATTEDQTGLQAGDYTITVTDANQCVETKTITVGNNTGDLAISNSNITDEICGNGTGAIDIEVSGGSMPYTYAWSNGGTAEDLTSLSAGNYSVTITDGSGCTLTSSFTVGNNTGNLAVSGTVINEVCGNSNGGVDLTVTGANGSVTYLWSNNSTLEDLSGVALGTYTCTVTDQSGCVATSESFVVNNSSGDLSITNQTVTNESCGNGLGAIDIEVDGTGAPFTYAWSNSATTQDINGLSAGVYSMTVTDANGCQSSTGNINVFNDASDLEIETNFVTNEICGNQQGAINVNVSGGDGNYTYAWSNASTSQDISNVSAGTYTLTVTDGNGCSATHTETVSNTPGTLAHVNSVVNNENCGDGAGAININVSGGQAPLTYAWSNAATTQNISGLSAGIYTVTISDANGCELEVSETVSNNASDLSITQAVTAEVCSNGAGAIDLTITGGQAPYSYAWSNSATSEDLSGLSVGDYSCVITDANSCSISTGTISVANNSGTLAVNEVVSDEVCGQGNGSIDLTIAGGQAPFTFAWSNAATTEDISGLSAGNYSYTVTDANSCSVSNNLAVINNSGTLAVTAQSTDEVCDDNAGAIDLTVTGGQTPYTFVWSNAATTEDISGLNSGNYTCTVTDANGCSIQTPNWVVTNNAGSLSLDNVQTNDEQCGNGLGSINITVSEGQAPYTYAWSNGAITEDVNGLSSGNYTCTITDANGCAINAVATVGNNSGSLSINGIVAEATCGNQNGAVDATVQGGSLPYTFSWSNGATTEDINSIDAGNYSLTVTDNGGCSLTESFQVNGIGGDLAISNASITEEICGNGAGAIDITVQNGTAPYTYAWSNGTATEDLSGIVAGTYSVTITDANSCSTTGTYDVNANNGTLSLDNVTVTDENCGDGAGAIDVTVSGGSAPLEFNWSNNETSEDLVNLSAGNYALTVTDNFGCELTTAQTIANISGGFTALVQSTTDENCGDGTGAINLTVSGGTTPYTFAWSNSATTQNISGLSAGDYNVVVSDANNCSISLDATIQNTTTGLEVTSAIVQPDNCGAGQGFIDINVNGGATPYTYTWSNAETTQDISGLTEGTYSCQITDNSGCVVNYEAEITDASGNIGITSNVLNENCGNGNGEIEVTATGGIAPFSFSWDGNPAEDCCEYTLNMFDTGNSWNGANIEVLVAGASVGTFTVPGGGQNTGTFEACTGQTIQLVWSSGTFDNEASFSLTNSEGTILYQHNSGVGPTPGVIFFTSSNCPVGAGNQTTNSGLSAGSYTVVVTDAVGCELTQTFDIINESSTVQLTSNQIDENCDNGSGQVTANASGGAEPYTYTLDGNAAIFGNTFLNLSGGTYELVATDANGCTASEQVIINNNTPFQYSVSITDDNCGQGIGALDLTLTNTINPTIEWTDGQTSVNTEDLTNVAGGDYELTINDQGCEITETYTVGNNSTFTVNAVISNETCSNQDGGIDVTVTGSGTYTFAWSNGADTEDLTNVAGGDYTLTVTDTDNNCSSTLNYTVGTDAFGMTLALDPNPDFCNQSQGLIFVNVSGGSGNYQYSWSNGETTNFLFNITAGEYTLTVTDLDNNCALTETAIVENEAVFEVNLTSITNEACGNGQGAIDVELVSGTPSFEWSNGETTGDISGLSAGVYTLTMTQGGCTDNLEAEVLNDAGFTVNSGVVNENCGDGNGAINISIAGQSGALTFNWSNGSTAEDLTGLSAGEYSVIIEDNGTGCQFLDTFQVENDASYSLTGSVVDATCANCNDGSIDLTINGTPTGNVTFSWSNGETTEDINNLLPGEYTVTATDGAGCSYSLTFTVNNTQSIEDVTSNWNVEIYPNPSNGIFNINYEVNSNEVSFEIVDAYGKYIEAYQQTGGNKFVLDLQKYQAGVYFVKIKADTIYKVYRIMLK